MMINFNEGAQFALHNVNLNSALASSSLAKLASGEKFAGVQDGSASYSISERMREQICSLARDSQNIQNGSSMLKIAERGIDRIIDNLRSMKELAINAANDSNTDADRATIQKEFEQRMSTINDIAISTNYNGKRLLDGTYSGELKTVTVQNTNTSSGSSSSTGSSTGSDTTQNYSETISGSNTDKSIIRSGIYTIDSNYSGTIQVDTTDAVKFVQADPSQALKGIQIKGPSGGGANILIDSLNIENDNDTSIIRFQGSNNVLTVTGSNTLKKGWGNYALINIGGGLNVQGTGSLTLDKTTSGNLINYGAYIGSDTSQHLSGDIIISGVSIVGNSHSGHSATIGSGRDGSIGNIIIENAKLTLHNTSGANIGSGVNASAGNITIINSTITSQTYSGAGVGSGSVGVGSVGSAGDITIINSTITCKTAIGAGVGSGSGASATVGDISIYNSTLNITTDDSACIGSGYKSNCVNDILVSNSVVTGKSTSGTGACIGTGANGKIGNITVINGTQVSHEASYSPAIGTGYSAEVTGKITYSDDIVVDSSKCYVHTDDADHPGIGRGQGGKVGAIEKITTGTGTGTETSTETTSETISTTTSTIIKGESLWLQHGTQANQHTNVYINSMQTKDLKGTIQNAHDKAQLAAYSNSLEKQAEYQAILDKAKNMTLDDARVTTIDDAKVAIRVVEGALEYALDQATTMGAYLQRLEYTATNVTTMSENVQNSESTIRDADMAKEMAEYTKYNILSQSAQAMFAQANQSSSAVLGLLQ